MGNYETDQSQEEVEVLHCHYISAVIRNLGKPIDAKTQFKSKYSHCKARQLCTPFTSGGMTFDAHVSIHKVASP